MKLLITGGSGFIGTNFIIDCLEKGEEILNIDIAEPKIDGHRKFWRNVDIRNYESLEKAVLGFAPEYIVHLAARTDLNGRSIEDYDTNTLGVENVLKVSEKLPNLVKIIIASSMLVCKVGYIPKTQFDYAPSTYYGESKVITEKTVWEHKPSCDWAIIRPTSIWGPWFGEPYRNFFDMVVKKRYFHIGNRGCTKTYGYVGNAVYQIEQILLHGTEDEEGKVFFIGDYRPTNIEEWADEIAAQLGYRILRVPYWMIWCAARVGDVLRRCGIKFPMTSFRLRNMTTDNVVELGQTQKVAGDLPYRRGNGIRETLMWLKSYNNAWREN